jgi:hypothetical protein
MRTFQTQNILLYGLTLMCSVGRSYCVQSLPLFREILSRLGSPGEKVKAPSTHPCTQHICQVRHAGIDSAEVSSQTSHSLRMRTLFGDFSSFPVGNFPTALRSFSCTGSDHGADANLVSTTWFDYAYIAPQTVGYLQNYALKLLDKVTIVPSYTVTFKPRATPQHVVLGDVQVET